MREKILKRIKELEKEIEELGINSVVFKDGMVSSVSGKYAIRDLNVSKATVLAAKIEGLKEALNLLNSE